MKEEIPTETPEPKKTWLEQLPISFKKKFWNSEKIISLSAFIVSIATLLALMYQIRISSEQNELARKQQYASVLPYLQVQTSINTGEVFYQLSLANDGVGPAFIEEIRVIYDGQTYRGDPYQFYRSIVEKTDTIRFSYGNITKGTVVPAGEEIPMLTVRSSRKEGERLQAWFLEEEYGGKGAYLEVVFSSVYEEQWITKGRSGVPELLLHEDKE